MYQLILKIITQQFYMSFDKMLEEQINLSHEESDSKISELKKNHKIKKSPKKSMKKVKDSFSSDIKNQIQITTHNIVPQFGMFQSQMQKQMRLDKFWKEEIDIYYRKEIKTQQKQFLKKILLEDVPSLKKLKQKSKQTPNTSKIPFEQIFRYIQLIKQCRQKRNSLILIQNEEKKYLGVFNQWNSINKLIEITEEQAILVNHREQFIKNLNQKQEQYNKKNNTNQYLGQVSVQVAFLLHLLRLNKEKLDQYILELYKKVNKDQKIQNLTVNNIEDQYISCLIKKNIKIALKNQKIDYFNYFKNLDILQNYGVIDSSSKPITDKKQFEEYVKKKKNKKIKKNKGILKSACLACLSPHNEQYNPFSHCYQCQVRFHKYCYSPNAENLCQICYMKKVTVQKTRTIQCQLCPNKGFLSIPLKQIKQNVNIHIFCMLINGLWKIQNTNLQFKASNYDNNTHDICSICNCSVYVNSCIRCSKKSHPLCAYLNGWQMNIDENSWILTLDCCGEFDKEKIAKQRKFILNYKKCVFKCEGDK